MDKGSIIMFRVLAVKGTKMAGTTFVSEHNASLMDIGVRIALF